MTMSDAELEAKLKELIAEKEVRDAVKREQAHSAHILRTRALQDMVREHIDYLEPKHEKGRYGGVCSDIHMGGARRTAKDMKDRNCSRCRLLAFAHQDLPDKALSGSCLPGLFIEVRGLTGDYSEE